MQRNADIRQSTSSAVKQSLWTTSTALKQNQPTQHQHSTCTPVDPSQWLAVVVECARTVEAPSTTQCLSEDDKEDLKLAHLRNYADIDNARCRVGSILRRCIQSTCFPHAASRKSNATRPKFEAAEMLANALCVTSGV